MTSRLRFILGIVLLTMAVGLSAQTTKARKRKPKPKPAPVEVKPALPPPQEVSPASLTLAQKPAVAPQVKYQNGQLSILAENSTLGDILRAVHQQTGAVVELPPNATERVVANLGPGPAKDVLSTLLNGSSFNYVMLGSPTNANDVNHLIVTAKASADTVASNSAQPGFNSPQRSPFVPQNGPAVTGGAPQEDNASEADSTSDENNADEPEDQAPAEGQSGEQAQQPNGGPAVKTPEQLLQELQRQQQIQQQQQGPQSSPQGFPIPPGQPPPQNQPQD
jgi:hypothetical protein